MVPDTVSLSKRFDKSVSVSASGGQETSFWVGSPKVSNEEIQPAIESAIERHRLFTKVVRGGQGDYMLSVRLIELKMPAFAIDSKVTARMEWRLRKVSSGSLIWSKIIPSEYTAQFGEALIARERGKLANEGAIRENIKMGLEQISRLSL